MRGLFRTLGVRHLGAAAGAILATLLAAPGGASAQCGGWVHDLGSYGPEFLRFFGPRVIDRDGSDGAQIPRIVGHTLDRIVMKSDEDWSFLTGRLHGYPFALEAWDADGPGPMTPRLYFGGTTTSSGAPIYLDSVPWPQSGSTGSHPLAPLPGPVYDMRLTDPDGAGPERPRPIVVCAGTPSRGTIVVLEWSGSAWIQRGSTLVGDWAYVRTAPSGSGSGDSWVLFGDVSRTGFPLVDGILTFDGAEWVSIGAGLQGGDIEGVAWWDHDAASSTPRRLVACGSFSKSGTATVKRVAVFDGSTWISIGDGLGGAAASIATYEHAATGREELLICVSGSPGIPPRFRAYDGVGWRNTGDVGDFYPPHAALQTWDPDGPLSNPPAALALLTGWDTQERAEPGLFIWNGLEWRVVAQPPRTWDSVQAPWDRDGDGPARPAIAHVRVHEFDPYATRDVVLWDGISWETQQTGLAAEYINAVTSWDPDGSGPKESLLVLGGVFTVPRAGEPDITNVVAWDGTSLVPLGEGLRIGGSWPGVRELATWDADGTGPALEELIAFGSIRGSGAESFGAIARFDGERWLPLGSGVWPKYGTSPDCIGAVAEWDPDLDGPLPAALTVGGEFSLSEGGPAIGLATWDGEVLRAFDNPPPGDDLDIWDITPLVDSRSGVAKVALQVGYARSTFFEDHDDCSWTSSETLTGFLLIDNAWTMFGSYTYGQHFYCGDSWYFGEGPPGFLTAHDPDGQGPLSQCLLYANSYGDYFGPGVGSYGLPTRAPLVGGPVYIYDYWGDYPENLTRHRAILSHKLSPDILVASYTGEFTELMLGSSYSDSANPPRPIEGIARWMEGPPRVLDVPEPRTNPETRAFGLTVRAIGGGDLGYQWTRNGEALKAGVTSRGSVVHSPGGPTLIISNASAADQGEYQCRITNTCGSTLGPILAMPQILCPSDANGDTTVDILDFLDFIQAFSECEGLPAPCGSTADADTNGDTSIDILDFLDFVDHFGDGC